MQNKKKTEALLLGVFGAYLLAGAGYSLLTAKWFPGFPPQLDVSMLFGGLMGTYIESALASLLGAACLYFAAMLHSSSA